MELLNEWLLNILLGLWVSSWSDNHIWLRAIYLLRSLGKTISCVFYDLHWEIDSFVHRAINLQMSFSPFPNFEKRSGPFRINDSDQEGNNSAPLSAFLNEQSQVLKTQCLTKDSCVLYFFNQHLMSIYYVQ